jgi:hypothetical protein
MIHERTWGATNNRTARIRAAWWVNSCSRVLAFSVEVRRKNLVAVEFRCSDVESVVDWFEKILWVVDVKREPPGYFCSLTARHQSAVAGV